MSFFVGRVGECVYTQCCPKAHRRATNQTPPHRTRRPLVTLFQASTPALSRFREPGSQGTPSPASRGGEEEGISWCKKSAPTTGQILSYSQQEEPKCNATENLLTLSARSIQPRT